MKRPHITIFAGLSKAHTFPALGLCPELVKRGHRVTFATDKHHATLVRPSGAEPIIFEPVKFELPEHFKDSLYKLPPEHPSWWTLIASTVYPWNIRIAEVAIAQLEAFYREDPPDLILYDHDAFAGRILAALLNTPAIQIRPHFARYERSLYWKDGIGHNPPPMLEFAGILDSFLRSYGIEEADNLWHVESLNICLFPRVFQYDVELFDDRYCFVGACLNRPFQPMWENKSGGKPIILVTDTTGSDDHSYFNALIDALSGREFHVILSVDEQFQKGAVQSLPANFEINQHASHLEIIPHTSLLICQAGMGGTLEAIYSGVPVIALPLSPSHEEVACRLVELGLGIRLPRHALRTDIIRHNVERVLADTSLLRRVKDMQDIFRRSGGAVMAADKIEDYLGIRRAA
jgi:MGT family glycosyltransferase